MLKIIFPTRPGTHDVVLETSAGELARCTVHVPETPAAAAPLVLVLHYGGEPSGFYGRPLLEMLATGAWRELGAVLVAPVAAGGAQRLAGLVVLSAMGSGDSRYWASHASASACQAAKVCFLRNIDHWHLEAMGCNY